MATLEQQRRASGAAMERSRRASGAAMEQSRRAGGHAMIERRTGAASVDEINTIVDQPRIRPTLRPVNPRGSISAERGRGVYTPPATGGGIASPLTEAEIASREYWASGLKSSDGLFVLPAIKTLNLTDANGAAVRIELANPEGTA